MTRILFENNASSVCAVIPDQQLLDLSLQISAYDKPFHQWSKDDHASSYRMMRRIAHLWKHNSYTDQYQLYAKISSCPFRWEMVPYQTCRTFIGRVIQQLQVLSRIVFGGIACSERNAKEQLTTYERFLSNASRMKEPSGETCKGHDPFCRPDTIDRQWVITGKKVNVLFNYAPIGFGGERLHFLVVPKEHRESLDDLTQAEYCESIELTTKLVDHLQKTRKSIHHIYLLMKRGKDAGQSVDHSHLHVIFVANVSQDFFGKATVVKNILLGSSPMKGEKLVKNIESLRNELSYLCV